MKDLENKIRKIINELSDAIYNKDLKVVKDDDIWSLYLYLNRNYTPLVISCQGTEEEFLAYIRDELKKRKLEKVEYWNTLQEPGYAFNYYPIYLE